MPRAPCPGTGEGGIGIVVEGGEGETKFVKEVTG